MVLDFLFSLSVEGFGSLDYYNETIYCDVGESEYGYVEVYCIYVSKSFVYDCVKDLFIGVCIGLKG